MHERDVTAAQSQEQAFRQYVQEAASPSAADQVAKLADLRDRGVISEAEFQQQKAKALEGRSVGVLALAVGSHRRRLAAPGGQHPPPGPGKPGADIVRLDRRPRQPRLGGCERPTHHPGREPGQKVLSGTIRPRAT